MYKCVFEITIEMLLCCRIMLHVYLEFYVVAIFKQNKFVFR